MSHQDAKSVVTAPHNDTPAHSLSLEVPQEGQLTYDAIVAAEAAKVELHKRAWAEAVRILWETHPAPKTSDDPIALTTGAMTLSQEGKAIQLPAEARRRKFPNLRSLYEWIRDGRRIGPKHDQKCYYGGAVVVSGDTTAANVGFVQAVTIDLDCKVDEKTGALHRVIKSQADFDLFAEFLRGLGAHILFTSASHDPANGKWCVKAVIPLAVTASYELWFRSGKLLRLQLADLFGVKVGTKEWDCIDPVLERPIQVQLHPAWKTQAQADQAVIELFEGPVWDPSPLYDLVRAEMEEEAKLQAAREEARAVTRQRIPGAPLEFHDDGSVDKIEGARRDLQSFPIRAGQGERNRRLPSAAWICREWSLDENEAAEHMADIYGPEVDDGGWCSRWARTIYSKPDTEGRDGRRLARAHTLRRLGAGGEFDLDAPCVGETGKTGAASEGSPTCALYRVCEDSMWAQHSTSPCNLPTYSRTVTVHTRQLPVVLDVGAQRSRLLFVKSPCGTGKSYALQPAVAKAIKEGQRVVIIVPRRSLAKAAARAYGIPCYLDLPHEIMGSCVICLDSVCRVQTIDFTTMGELEIDLLVLDEMQQLARHRVGGTIRGAKMTEQVHKAMKTICQISKKIRAQDADLTELGERVVHQWLEWDPETSDWERLVNTCKALDVTTYTRRDEGAHLEEMWRARRSGHAIAEYCTSVVTCEAHAAAHLELFPDDRLLIVDGDTPGCPEVQAFLDNPSLAANYDGLYFTGALQTGVSIEVREKFRVFACVQATPQGMGPIATDVYQGLSRVRHPVADMWHVCMMGSVRRGPENAQTILEEDQIVKASTWKDLQGVVSWRPKYGVDGIPRVSDCDHEILRGRAEVKAYENMFGGNFHDTVDDNGNMIEEGAISRLWKDKGLRIISLEALDLQNELAKDVEVVKAEQKIRKERRRAVKVKKGTAASKAPKRSFEEIKELEAKDMTPEIRAEIDSASIRHRYGLQEVTVDDYLWDKNGGWAKVVNFSETLLVQRGEVDAVRAIDAKGSGVSIETKDAAVKAQHRAAWWKKIGILDFAQDALAGTVLKDPGRVLMSKANRDYLRIFLGMQFKQGDWSDGMVLVRALVRAAGLRLKEVGRDSTTRKRIYALEPASVSEMLQRSRAHYDLLLDPSAAKAQVIELQPMSQREADERVEAILAA